MDQNNMQEEIKLKSVENMSETKISHELKIALNNIIKLCEANKIPFFMTYYADGSYSYRGLFPEEIDDPALMQQYGRFPKFFETVVDFNKKDFLPTININGKK